MRSTLAIVLVAALCSVMAATAGPTQPQDPIIGIVSEPVTHSECVSLYQQLLKLPRRQPKQVSGEAGNEPSPFMKSLHQAAGAAAGSPAHNYSTLPPVPGPSGCIWSVYVDWLEASGIRVLPIPWDSSEEKLMYVLDRVNGVLLAGGILGWIPSLHAEFFKVAQKIYQHVIDQNKKGNPMVLWGTCQGFEMLNSAAAGNFSIVKHGFKGMEPLMMSVNFTNHAQGSKLFGTSANALSAEGQRVRHYMENDLVTLNWHMYGIPPTEYDTNPTLHASGMRPLSTTNDVDGRTFTSSVESSAGPIFGVQFHPERVMFELDNNNIFHTSKAIQVSEYLGNFLVTQLRNNTNTFENATEAESLLMANYPRFNIGAGIRIYNV